MNRPWTEDENELLRSRYPDEGPSVALVMLLDRSHGAIVRHVRSLGVRMSSEAFRRVRKSCVRMGKNSAGFKGSGRVYGKYIGNLRVKAKSRNLDWTVLDGSIENTHYLDSITTDICPLSGLPLTYPTRIRDSTATASLDRIDSSQGYVKDNVRWIHKDINEMKWALTDEEFFSLVRDIAVTHPKP